MRGHASRSCSCIATALTCARNAALTVRRLPLDLCQHRRLVVQALGPDYADVPEPNGVFSGIDDERERMTVPDHDPLDGGGIDRDAHALFKRRIRACDGAAGAATAAQTEPVHGERDGGHAYETDRALHASSSGQVRVVGRTGIEPVAPAV
jgi:hypothetical protein